MTLAEAARPGTLTGEGSFSSDKRTYTYGTAAAHVAVDPKTGAVEVLDYVVVDDVGRTINPLTLARPGRRRGGAGLRQRVQRRISSTTPTANCWSARLPIIRSRSRPTIRISGPITLEQFPAPHNPLGAKGAGEGGIIPVGGAVTNAIASALSSLQCPADGFAADAAAAVGADRKGARAQPRRT